ncbi:MAG: hypothetical protein KatS3mg061_1197 [Dehalococcoidia bacterium]|nr:MAG: hypothetical protein KatS3mg061_1197 [Dehalococcoidia bacterium]
MPTPTSSIIFPCRVAVPSLTSAGFQQPTFLSANGRTSDVLLFGDPSFRELLHRFALPDFQELVLPGGATLDPATEAHLRTLVAGRRVWFVPHPANPREETVIALLDGLKRRSEDRTHGLVRLLRWDDP